MEAFVRVVDAGSFSAAARHLRLPGRLVIAPDRTIVYAEVNPDYTRRPEPEAMLPALQQINQTI